MSNPSNPSNRATQDDREAGGVLTPLLIDAKAAAELLNIGARTLWSYTNCRAIPSRKIGRIVRYCPIELRAWIDAGCPTDAGAGDRIRLELRKARSR